MFCHCSFSLSVFCFSAAAASSFRDLSRVKLMIRPKTAMIEKTTIKMVALPVKSMGTLVRLIPPVKPTTCSSKSTVMLKFA